MSIWLEIHCDIRKDGINHKDILFHRCYSHRNDNVMAMSGNNSITSVRNVLKFLEQEAIDQGWVKVGSKWACPGCKDDPSNKV